MSEPTVLDDPMYQLMNGDFDPTGFEKDVDAYVICGCTGNQECPDCLPF